MNTTSQLQSIAAFARARASSAMEMDRQGALAITAAAALVLCSMLHLQDEHITAALCGVCFLAQAGWYSGIQPQQMISRWKNSSLETNQQQTLVKSILKEDSQGKSGNSSAKKKSVRFDSDPKKRIKLLGFAYPTDQYDRSSTIPKEPETIVDMMTYVVASLPSDTDEELDDYQRSFFIKMVLRVFNSKRFGSEQWVEENEPFFSDTVDTYLQFDEELRDIAVTKIRAQLRASRAQMPNVRMARIMALDAHLNRVQGGSDRAIARTVSWSDDAKAPIAKSTAAVDNSARP